MEKKMISGLGLCIILLIFFAGCIESNEMDPTIKKIKEAGVLKVGTCTPFEPMEYVDKNGSILGFDIDIAEMIAKHLGVKTEIKDYPYLFDNISVPLEKGEVDMIIAAITITTERSKQVLFSRPYLNAGQIIIVNASNMDIKSEIDLFNKTVGVQRNTTGEEEALKYTNSSSQVMSYQNYELALLDLIAGKIDAIIVDYPTGVALIKDKPGLKLIGMPFTNEFYGIAVKKGEKALVDEINSVIVSLGETGKMDELKEKWFLES
ncbi:MAG: basic amino acid ABC transporter substrate-binding protein [Candidatus Thermoplasmatota archaeon]|jgi:polar amino acid transport system substrate-binding protein|nr:basic amino acid ABC transporter substrate-binding protein [Candidatus Thermoplasmatota archaeon]